MTTTQGIKLDSATSARLKALGEARDRSPHWLMKTAILEYLEREEAYERLKREDMARWEQYQLTGEYVPHEQVATWLRDIASGQRRPWPR
ncbi:MAG: ribbon-helix-helix protein, CopG family [Chloroflexi bacterium]|nr:ribbon-helix-helix protein, CopG family [Chloroflexota bacterium]